MAAWVPFAGMMAVAVAVLLVGERRGRRALVLVAKPLASACFVLLAWSRWHAGDRYGAWVLLALVLSLAGDVLLIFPRAFLAGLVSFLLAHVAYIGAFHVLVPARAWPLQWATPVVAASVLAASWLWPHLGSMRVPVLVYVTVITVMVWGAAGSLAGGKGSALALAGAVLFYLSDLSVARDRFVARAFVNRAWGLPAYYLGQLLLALSVRG